MPVCLECRGVGQIEKKRELTTRCPNCDGSKRLPDGLECKRCDKWGEIATGEFEVEKQLCTTCWGSGKVSEGSLTAWFLLRVVPASLLLVGGGVAAAWGMWAWLGNSLAVAAVTIIFFGGWASLMVHFIGQMPGMGEISPTNWFLIRAIPTTLTALAIGAAVVWSSWDALQSAPVTAVLALAAFALWGVLMYYFISHLPE
jgi:hypothetical protein